MIGEDILIRKDARLKKLSDIEEEPWIGKHIAYQLPTYYWVMKTMTKKDNRHRTKRRPNTSSSQT